MNNRLKVLRAMRDWSQAELAGRLEVSRQAVNAIETGKHDPSLPLAFRIARLFGLPEIEWLENCSLVDTQLFRIKLEIATNKTQPRQICVIIRLDPANNLFRQI